MRDTRSADAVAIGQILGRNPVETPPALSIRPPRLPDLADRFRREKPLRFAGGKQIATVRLGLSVAVGAQKAQILRAAVEIVAVDLTVPHG